MATFTGIGKLLKDVVFSDLTTSAKNIIGAINELNTGKVQKPSGGYDFYIGFIASNPTSIDGTIYSDGTVNILYFRMGYDDRHISIGTALGGTSGKAWKYTSENKILLEKYVDGTWSGWKSL